MSRDKDFLPITFRQAAASAATVTSYYPLSAMGYGCSLEWSGFAWMYEATEANADNSIDFVIDYTVDGTNYTTLHTNANAFGLLDSAAPLVVVTNKGDAGSGGGAAVAVSPTLARIPGDATIRLRLTTAGTGTIPAVQFVTFGKVK